MKFRKNLPFILPVVTAAKAIFTHYGLTHPWTELIPGNYMIAASGGILFLYSWQQIIDPNSTFRSKWKQVFSSFEIEQIFANPLYQKGKGDVDRVALYARLRFKKSISNAKIKIFITPNQVGNEKRQFVMSVPLGDREKDEIMNEFPILVKHISRPNWTPRHDSFGLDTVNEGTNYDKAKSSLSNFQGLIELELNGTTRDFFIYTAPMKNSLSTGIRAIETKDINLLKTHYKSN